MKLKPWVTYLLYTILLFFVIIIREHFEKLLSAAYYRFEHPAIYLYAVISLLLGILLGLILGIEYLLKEYKNVGVWRINLPRLLLMGIPTLYFSLTNLLLVSGNQLLHNIITYPFLNLFGFGSGYVVIVQIILGYVIITSFYRYKENV